MKIEDILGSCADKVDHQSIIAIVTNILKMKSCKNFTISKCFTMPVNLLNKHIDILKNNDYLVGDKADGVRFLLVVANDSNYLVSRNETVYKLRANIFHADMFDNSIFDGELVLNKLTEGNRSYFIAYDVLAFKKSSLLKKKFDERYKTLFGIEVNNNADIGFIIKTFYKLEYVQSLVQNIIPNMPYKSDGLIFIRLSSSFVSGCNTGMFKWKRAEEHTIDFNVVPINGAYSLYVSDKPDPIYTLKDIHEQSIINYINHKTKENSKAIVEFMYFNNNFIAIKQRDDKTSPNSFNTCQSTLESIKENIQLNTILNI